MERTINVEKLREKKLFVATPMYSGNCTGLYTKSTNELAMACAKHGIEVKFYYQFNESLITRARNYCADEFLRSGFTHLMFIDSDVGFQWQDVLMLMQMSNSVDEYGIVTGAYPKKTISWEKIKLAVDKGVANDNPFVLEQFVGDYVFNLTDEVTSFKIDEPVKLREAGTGFMMIHREVLVKYAEAYPELSYIPDHIRSKSFDGSREITAFFDTVIEKSTKRYLSEDYMFCHHARNAGIDVWLCPWMQLKHVGTYMFGGSLGALAYINASPTASPESNQKSYEAKAISPPAAINKTINRQQRRSMRKVNK